MPGRYLPTYTWTQSLVCVIKANDCFQLVFTKKLEKTLMKDQNDEWVLRERERERERSECERERGEKKLKVEEIWATHAQGSKANEVNQSSQDTRRYAGQNIRVGQARDGENGLNLLYLGSFEGCSSLQHLTLQRNRRQGWPIFSTIRIGAMIL